MRVGSHVSCSLLCDGIVRVLGDAVVVRAAKLANITLARYIIQVSKPLFMSSPRQLKK